MRTAESSPARALLTLALGGVLAVVFGVIGYQFRGDIVGVFMGMMLAGTALLPGALIWQYVLGQRRDGGSS